MLLLQLLCRWQLLLLLEWRWWQLLLCVGQLCLLLLDQRLQHCTTSISLLCCWPLQLLQQRLQHCSDTGSV
jgi:hypothetical protein